MSVRQKSLPPGLIALAIGAFGIGLTEFVIMGLLPEVAADFAVTEPVAGWLISGYALSVAVGGVALTAAVTRLPRKPVLLGLMVLFIIGNLLSAVAGDYAVMMAGRIVAALCHGAFFGIGAVVAAGLVAPARRAGAIAMMFAGLTIANVLGVPFGTFLGQHFGWRSTFWAITAIGVVALIGLALLIPGRAAATADRPSTAACAASCVPSRTRRSGSPWSITVLGFGGMFGAFTYIAYTLTEVSGFASQHRAVAARPLRSGALRRQPARRSGGGQVTVAHPGHRPGGAHRGARRLRADRRRARC